MFLRLRHLIALFPFVVGLLGRPELTAEEERRVDRALALPEADRDYKRIFNEANLALAGFAPIREPSEDPEDPLGPEEKKKREKKKRKKMAEGDLSFLPLSFSFVSVCMP